MDISPFGGLRTAEERDLDTLVSFELTIALISFGSEAIVDPDVHRRRLRQASTREREKLLVAVDTADQAIGFLWYAININFMTQDRYLNLRSLAVASDRPDREDVGETLLREGIAVARREGASSITGKVHVDNHGMRMLYRRIGLGPTTLTMRARIEDLNGSPS